MRFLADENYPVPSVRHLREADHDVAAIITDSPGASDEAVLRRAVVEQRIVLTFDRDFGALLFRMRSPAPPGVVYFRVEPAYPNEPAEMLLRLLATAGVVLDGHFTVVDRRQIRQRPLQ